MRYNIEPDEIAELQKVVGEGVQVSAVYKTGTEPEREYAGMVLEGVFPDRIIGSQGRAIHFGLGFDGIYEAIQSITHNGRVVYERSGDELAEITRREAEKVKIPRDIHLPQQGGLTQELAR